MIATKSEIYLVRDAADRVTAIRFIVRESEDGGPFFVKDIMEHTPAEHGPHSPARIARFFLQNDPDLDPQHLDLPAGFEVPARVWSTAGRVRECIRLVLASITD